MAAANFSRDVLEMFYGPIEESQGLIAPIRPTIMGEFEIVRNNFDQWLRVWKMQATKNNKDLFKFFQKTKTSFINVCKNEVEALKSVKIQFSLLVKFHMTREEKVEEMEHYFNRMQPVIVNEHNMDTLSPLLNQFIHEVKGEIEAWSERGSGWVMDKIVKAFINVARYQPMRGGSYMELPAKLKNKKAVLNIQIRRDNECLRWAIRAALFPAPRGRNPMRTSSYPTEDGLNFTGIDFPTPVSQIGRLERQNQNLAINVFGWEDGRVIVHRISEKDGEIPRINLMLVKKDENSHYCLVKRLSALLYDQNRHNESKHFCERCLHGYKRRELLERHKPECKGLLKSPTRTEMPKEGENKMAFQNFYKQMKAPYVVYADFECIVKKIHTCEPDNKKSFTVKTEKQEPCGFSYVVVRSDGQTQGPYTYRGEDAVYVFLRYLQEHEKEMREDMANNRPLVMTNEDWQKYRNAAECHICSKSLYKDLYLDSMAVYDPDSGKYSGQSHRKCYHKAVNNRYVPREWRRPKDAIDQWIANTQETCLFCADPLLVPHFKDSVRDHDHMTGKYRGAAHNECNFKLKMNSKTMPIPVIFHNLKGYDGHLLMQAMARVQGEIKCIATNTEKYMSFSLGNLRFIDSLNFLLNSLEKVVDGCDEFPIMERMMPEENKRQLLLKKGVYPYEYMDSFERFGETQLPEKEKFYSSLYDEGITDEEYERAKQVWGTFGCRNLGDYHNLYVATDTLLLADVFENFRKVCQEKYGLDPAHYYSAPGLSWDALLKKTGVELELLTDLDMHLFIERGMRGGISMASKRYAKANNPLVEGYDPAQPTNYITYLDANNLYGWAMTQHLPKSGFHWKRVMPTEEQIMKMRPNSKKGWILEVDLEYPAYLHDAHNDYPLAPEKIKPQQMSEYQRRLMNGLNLAMPGTEKLVLTLEDKEKYVTHYRNLQFYLRQGMRLKKVHRVIKFDQEPSMAPYIMMNTEFRKQAKNNFETDFYKLMNNSVFGKTMENLRNRVDVKIVREWENDKIRKLLSSPSFDRFTIFGNDMAGIHMHKTKLVLNKPVYTGMTILENSKILMYDFFYNQMKARYGHKCGLVYTDTDSLILDIQTEDVYKDMQENSWMYDTSNYPKDSLLYSVENNKALGKMKDECGGRAIKEVVAVRPKMYSVEVGEKNVRKAKGVKKCVIEKEITHEHYKEALFERKQFLHKMKILRSEGHEMYGMRMNKISISPFDTKRWIADGGIHTAAYGHFRLAAAGY